MFNLRCAVAVVGFALLALAVNLHAQSGINQRLEEVTATSKSLREIFGELAQVRSTLQRRPAEAELAAGLATPALVTATYLEGIVDLLHALQEADDAKCAEKIKASIAASIVSRAPVLELYAKAAELEVESSRHATVAAIGARLKARIATADRLVFAVYREVSR